jgi:hypothetical protein
MPPSIISKSVALRSRSDEVEMTFWTSTVALM